MSLSGSVTLANTRLSLVNGYAFFDTSAANADYANNINSQIEVTSVTTGKKAIGYIKAVGTGQTYSEIIVNGGFEGVYAGGVAPNWACGRGTPSEYIADPLTGSSSQQINNPAGNNGFVGPAVLPTATGGALYYYGAYYKALAGSAEFRLDDNISGHIKTFTGLTSATWAFLSGYWTLQATATKLYPYLYAASHANADTNSIAWDSAFVRKVLTPSSTGVTITSTPNGSTYNWASIESGFNYNDALGYTWKIIPHTRFSRGRRRYIDAYGIERTVFYK